MSEEKVIHLEVKNEDDLYLSFESKGKILKEEVIEFIATQISKAKIYEQVVICLESEKDVNLETFQKAYQNQIEERIEKIKIKKGIQNIRAIRLLVIGAVFLFLSFSLNSIFDPIVIEILSLVGSFSIWGLTDIFLLEKKELKRERYRLERQMDCKIQKRIIERD